MYIFSILTVQLQSVYGSLISSCRLFREVSSVIKLASDLLEHKARITTVSLRKPLWLLLSSWCQRRKEVSLVQYFAGILEGPVVPEGPVELPTFILLLAQCSTKRNSKLYCQPLTVRTFLLQVSKIKRLSLFESRCL